MLVDGKEVKEIASALGIKKGTVRKYLHRTRGKVGAKSLYQCIAVLITCGELSISEKRI